MYKLYKFSWDAEPNQVVRDNGNGTSTCIPFDPQNRDYAEYLAWIEAGNTPLPAEEQTGQNPV